MTKWKDILLHTVPVVALGVGAIFGLTSEESNSLSQIVTTIIGAVFGLLAIWMHHKKPKDKPPKHLPTN